MRMTLTRAAVAAAFAIVASGCATMNEPWPPGAGAGENAATRDDTCGRAAHARLVGMDAGDIDPATLPAGARILTPDMMVTQDYRAERLNIVVGTDGRVGSLACY
ncbi:MAG: hypothetical protein GC206_09105 [Alphaproteobacteria bacterium]|nr:hypothetical protein [Alphaproteobacteria bacterium]